MNTQFETDAYLPVKRTMLEALREAVDFLQWHPRYGMAAQQSRELDELIRKWRAVIAQAEGQQ